MPEPLRVNRIEIDCIKGIEHCELRLEGRQLLRIKGANGTGKSSILDAIASVFEGGSDPAMVRQGAKQGTVLIELSDGTAIKKTQSAKQGAKVEIRTKDGEVVDKPQTYIDKLAASFAFDPLAFCRADSKKRAEYLVKALNLSFTGKEVGAIKFGKLDVGGPVRDLVGPEAALSLDQFDELRKKVYERRRQANASVKELDETVKNLRRSLPSTEEGELGVGMGDMLQSAQGQLAALEAAEKKDLEFIAGQLHDAKKAEQEKMQVAIEAARALMQKTVDEARAKYDAEIAEIQADESEATEAVRQERAPERARLQQAIGEAQANLKRQGEIEALQKHLGEQQRRWAVKVAEAEALDKALDGLDELKRSKVEKLPIEGLELRDGEVYVGGIPFDHLNQQKRYETSFEVGTLLLGDLPLVVGDEAEHLDAEHLKEFEAALASSPLQVILAQVDDGPLRSEPQGALKL